MKKILLIALTCFFAACSDSATKTESQSDSTSRMDSAAVNVADTSGKLITDANKMVDTAVSKTKKLLDTAVSKTKKAVDKVLDTSSKK